MNPEKFENQQPPQENSFVETPIQPEQKIEQAETLESVETVDESKIIEEYKENNFALQEEIIQTEQTKESLIQQVSEVREDLYDGNIPSNVDTPSIDVIDAKLEALRLEQIKTSSNYPGDWTLLLRERMLNQKEKFIETREESMSEMKQGEPGKLDKPKQFAQHYQNQIDGYDQNVENIFSSTEYIKGGFNARNLGTGNIGLTGTVYIDAIKSDQSELTPRQKNVIEAHEKGHGLRDFHSSIDARDFKNSIDADIVSIEQDEERKKRPDANFANYMNTAEEIAERMAQLKNYFGMKAGDIFTKDHLKYAADHYISDIGLDNNMSIFFKAITERTVDKFVDTVNKYPL